MADLTDLAKDLRVRNVGLHSRGKTEIGTLYLTRHHLIFSYLPNTTAHSFTERASIASTRSDSGQPESGRTSLADPDSYSRSTDTKRPQSTAPAQPSLPDSRDKQRSSCSSDSAQKTSLPKPKVRPKEIWLPYPMINHCMLRPSHSQSRASDQTSSENSTDEDIEDSAFPPTFGTNAYTRPSMDNPNLLPSFSPQRSISPGPTNATAGSTTETGKAPALRIRRRDFQMMAFHFHPSSSSEKSPDDTARDVLYRLRSRCCVNTVQDLHAFHFKAPQEEITTGGLVYDARREFARMGIEGKNMEGPGSAWRISDINHDYGFAATYPGILCVPRAVTDNILKYGGAFRSKSRIPALTYLHSNGGSISRSSQPMVGVQAKRNPQDERLVSEIFCSHTPQALSPADSLAQSPTIVPLSTPTIDSVSGTNGADGDVNGSPLDPSDTTLDQNTVGSNEVPRQRVYGSTRRSLIVDARPKINALANRATGGGIEDVSNYTANTGVVVERVFLNIANIHVMRQALAKVVEAFASSDYLDMKPNQDLLRKSGWLGHISGLLEGAEMVARVVGLGGSHVLVHCSDGWDRTSQVAALAEIMLDPFYRTLRGFITLVQKDFLSFGHKFNHRHGIQGSEKWFEIENERVLPTRGKEGSAPESTSFNALGSKAFTGAKNWFDKNRANMFRQQGEKSGTDGSTSRPPSPPPNSLLHAPPTPNPKPDNLHKVDTKEIAPIFHQFLDAVFQLQHHKPNSFEFNERFLIRLFYQAHSAQYGEFLFNTEKERNENTDKTNSVWSHFLSRKREFINPDYVAKIDDPLLFASRQAPGRDLEVVWWTGLFGRKPEDMRTAEPLIESPIPKTSIFDSIPQFSTIHHDNTPSSAKETQDVADSRGASDPSKDLPAEPRVFGDGSPAARPTLEQRETDQEILAGYVNGASLQDQEDGLAEAEPEKDTTEESAIGNDAAEGCSAEQAAIEQGDPLGVSAGGAVPEKTFTSGRLDFAAFARESAYSDR